MVRSATTTIDVHYPTSSGKPISRPDIVPELELQEFEHDTPKVLAEQPWLRADVLLTDRNGTGVRR
jgi:hypothetical protein